MITVKEDGGLDIQTYPPIQFVCVNSEVWPIEQFNSIYTDVTCKQVGAVLYIEPNTQHSQKT